MSKRPISSAELRFSTAGMHSAQVRDSSEQSPSRVVILAMRPEVDGGRYPAKRVVGERVDVEVDLVADGHDVVRGVLLHQPPGVTQWEEIELQPAGNDVWRASFVATALGRHMYTALVWVDAFASWRHGLERKVKANSDVHVELLEGAVLADAAAKRAQDPTLVRLAAALRSSQPIGERIAIALGTELADAMKRAPDRTHAARYRCD